jgi:hypothetical protein
LEEDLKLATRFFEVGGYDKSLEFCASHKGSAHFDSLAAAVAAEQQILRDDQESLDRGDYNFIPRLRGQTYAGKPAFAALLKTAGPESSLLEDLKKNRQADGWEQVQKKLAEPSAAAVLKKKPFDELKAWADGRAAEEAARPKDIGAYDARFQVLLVQFNVLSAKDDYIKSPDAKKAEFLNESLALDAKDFYSKQVAEIEKQFRAGKWLDPNREKLIKKLKDAINVHD